MAEIKLGIVTKTVGVDGTFLIKDVPDNIFSLKDHSIVNIGFSYSFSQEYKIKSIAKKNKGIQLLVEGIDSKEKANLKKNNAVFTLEENIIKEDDNKYSINEIINCDVIDVETEKVIGKIIKEEDYPAHKIWTVEYNFKEVLVPVVDEIVKYIDIENKKVGINIIPGLFEANL